MDAAPGEKLIQAFPSYSKPYVSTGLPFSQACAYHVEHTFKALRVFLIVSSSISRTANFTLLQEALGDRLVGIRYGIKPHTPWTDILEIVREMHEKDADMIITLGGGSLTDGAKVVAFALANEAFDLDAIALLAADRKTPHLKPVKIPVINVPTTLSGAEYAPNGGATDMRSHRKSSFAHLSMGAEIIILDPALSISTPERVWLSSGLRAIDHCVEGLCSVSPAVSPESDKSFQDGLRLLVPSLFITKKDFGNLDARLQEMMGVVEATRGKRFGVPMGASHGIGHQLGPLGVGHGETTCVILPWVLRWNYINGDDNVRRLQQKVLDVFWTEATAVDILEKRGLKRGTADASDVVGALIDELGMPRTLEDVGIGADKLDALADNSLKDRWIPQNPVPLTEKKQILEILDMALKG